ncbi:MAG: ORF6N domain-containing protein [Paludibacteraceae bacterium]|nr:ORF6N domain-containing protein [Paludibacteraceae bacterium]
MEESSFNASATGGSANGAGFELKPQVFNVRGKRVVLDREVAAHVGMSTGNLNLYVKRNIQLFDTEMRFKLSEDECSRLQIVTLNKGRGSNIKYLPFAFTAEGVSMLEKVLKRSIPIEFGEEIAEVEVLPESWSEGTVVMYKLNDTTDVDVYIYKETAWLRQEQISKLFGVKQPIISKHLSNIFQSGELEKNSVYSILEYTARDGKTYYTAFYNLDAVLSVGYRVNSINATKFRQWANRVLRNYILRGGSLENRVVALEEGLRQTNNIVYENQKQFDIILKNALPPVEQIFMQGQFFDAYKLFSDLSKVHDRFMIIDDTLYSSGGSFKDAGKKLFSFEKMELSPDVVLNIVRNG